MDALSSSLFAATLAVTVAPPGAAQATGVPAPLTGFYLGGEIGPANIKIPGRDVTMAGMDFTNVRAQADQMGMKFFVGYWINEHIGFEFGGASLGNADASFDYFDPPSERGTGVSDVSITNTTLSLQAGYRLGKVLVFARGGIQFWRLTYESRFDLSDGTNHFATLEKKGNSFFGGIGATWNFTGKWGLRVEGEMLKMDITDARMISLGLEYRW